MPFVSVLHTSSNRLLLSNQDKGCTPCVAHSLPLPLGPALLNLWTKIHVDVDAQTHLAYQGSFGVRFKGGSLNGQTIKKGQTASK